MVVVVVVTVVAVVQLSTLVAAQYLRLVVSAVAVGTDGALSEENHDVIIIMLTLIAVTLYLCLRGDSVHMVAGTEVQLGSAI